MSVKPDDVDQDAWDAARHALSDGFEIRIESHGHAVRVARAIMAAKEEEREALASWHDKEAHKLFSFVEEKASDLNNLSIISQAINRALHHEADALEIRKRSSPA